jgi:hypothetical protein
MAVDLSRGDVVLLQRILQLLLSPREFDSSLTWRAAVCQQVMEWVQTDGVHLTLTGDSERPMVGVGKWGPTVHKEYFDRWHDRAEIDQLRDARRVRTWVRDEIIRPDEFRGTRYFKEFCQPISFHDSAGAMDRFPDGEKVILHVTSSRPGKFPPGGRTATVLALVQPALVAGAAMIRSLRQQPDLLAADAPFALVDMSGQLVHAAASLDQLLGTPAIGDLLQHQITLAALEASRTLLTRPIDRPPRPVREFEAGGHRFVVSATLIPHGLSTSPLCCVLVRRLTDSQACFTTLQLTTREKEVAGMLECGFRNRDIARAPKAWRAKPRRRCRCAEPATTGDLKSYSERKVATSESKSAVESQCAAWLASGMT